MLAAWKLFGHQLLLPVPDIDRTQFFLCLGGNPMASNGSLMTAPGIRHRIRALQARGGRFVVVDPRRTETAAIADEHFFIRPGTWARTRGCCSRWCRSSSRRGLPLRAGRPPSSTVSTSWRATWRASRRRRQTSPASRQRTFAGSPATSPTRRAIAYGRVGLCTQEFGGLATWLVYVLNVVTGNLDREGGLMFSTPGSRSAPARGRGGAGCHRALYLINAVEREPWIKVAVDSQISHLVGDDGLQAVEVKSSPPGSA